MNDGNFQESLHSKRAHGLIHGHFLLCKLWHSSETFHSDSVNSLRELKIQCVEKKAVGVHADGAITAFEFQECRRFDPAF